MLRSIRTGFILTALTAVMFSSVLAQNEKPILGVLEDSPGHNSDAPNYRSVRVLFYYDAHEWKAYPTECAKLSCLQSATPSLTPEVIWTIGLDGRSLGKLTTQLLERPDQTLWGQFPVDSKSAASIGKPTLEFAGWMGGPVLRPLVLNSRPFVGDPERWKPSTVSGADAAKLRLAFKRKYPMLTSCENMDAKQYADADIRVAKAYRSKRGWQVVQLAVKGCAPDDERGDELSMEWYVVSPDGRVRYLDSNMHLVDAGDYDNDGKSELIFSIDDYNRGGYKLFYNDFKQKAVFEFSYH